MWALILILVIIIAVIVINRRKKKHIAACALPPDTGKLLEDNVAFYSQLSVADKKVFEERVRDFLANTAVSGVAVTVTDLDRLLVAASAIIPIFSFPGWRYNNITEVLLYKDAFSKEYKMDGAGRDILGMVGNGALQGQMILTQPALRAGFSNPADGHNTAIHEFVHLIDKADGATDGVPEYLLSQPHIQPWIEHMHDTIRLMRGKGHSDINLYGATNDAEFFAVISEYYFERPDELKEKHPDLYSLLHEMFQPAK
jgi:Mlc titration factor MtfA (ptsG expression regulator)